MVFRAGLWVLGGEQQKRCHPRRRQPIGDLVPHNPWGSPLYAFASAGMTLNWKVLAIGLLIVRNNPQTQIAQLLRGGQGWGAHHQVLGVLVHGEHDDISNVGGAS